MINPIAAILAAQTPIGTQYRLLDVPGTELTDAECPLCAGPHTLTQCAEWAGGPRLIEGLRAEITMLEDCLSASNKQYNRLTNMARNACNVLEAIVDGTPLPMPVLAAYDALYDELNPPECE